LQISKKRLKKRKRIKRKVKKSQRRLKTNKGGKKLSRRKLIKNRKKWMKKWMKMEKMVMDKHQVSNSSPTITNQLNHSLMGLITNRIKYKMMMMILKYQENVVKV